MRSTSHPSAGQHSSPAKRLGPWLARQRPSLSFAEPLETQFREWYANRMRWRSSGTLWLAVGNILLVAYIASPFFTLRETLFGTQHGALLGVVGAILLASSMIAVLFGFVPSLYRRWYDLAAQVISPARALCFAALDVLMRMQGYSLGAWMPIVVVGPYFIFGMSQFQAARASLLAVLAFIVAGEIAGVNDAQRWGDIGIALFASTMGAVIHFTLQRAVRHGYLATQSLNESAHRDSLTGIHNRRMFDEHVQRVWQQASRESLPVGLLLIDLDHFKAFNDTHGHQVGDVCLAKVAALLPQVARRPLDLAARYGGEEFVVLLYDARREQVEEVCIQLHAALKLAAIPHRSSASGVVTFSIGVACIQPQSGRHVEGLIQLADEALYAAKERGRDRTVIMDREYETLKTGAFRARRAGGSVSA